MPLALVGLAFLSLIGKQSVYTDHVAHTLRNDLSSDAFALANRTALRTMSAERAWWLTGGLLVTIWGAGAALRAMMRPLNAIYGSRETRSYRRRLATSLAGGAIVLACVYGAIALTLGGRLVHPSGAAAVGFFVVRWAMTLLLLLLAIATLIRAVPAKKRPIEWVTVGSVFSAVCWVVATAGFAAYISAVSYSSYFGAFAALVLLLVYLHVTAIAFLVGVVLDAELREQV